MDRRGIGIFSLMLLGAVATDLLSKIAIRTSLTLGEKVWLIPPILSFTHVSNTGAAFSMLTGNNMLLIWLSIAALGFLGYYLPDLEPRQTIPVGLIAGGIIGNLIDRVAFGAVTDFIDFQFFPVFNAADSCLVIGVAILLLQSLMPTPTGKKN